MNIVFFGNTKYSRLGAEIIHHGVGISRIVTLPDRPDKKKNLLPNPVKQFALEQNIPYLTTEKLTGSEISQIASLEPDFFIVEDYGLILPKKLLLVPKYASLNIHHSLLPKYRGTSPAPYAILAGEEFSGVSVISMAEKVDAGDILTQTTYELTPGETTESLLTQLNIRGGNLIIPVLQDYLKGNAHPQKQDETKATFTKLITKGDGFFDLDNPPPHEQLDRMIRAYYPWPGVWTKVRIKNHPLTGTGESRIKFLPENIIQVEGGKPMSKKDFINGYPELRERVEKLFNK